MYYAYLFIAFFVFVAIVGISVFSMNKEVEESGEGKFLTDEEVADAKMLKDAEEAESLEDAVRVYHHARHGEARRSRLQRGNATVRNSGANHCWPFCAQKQSLNFVVQKRWLDFAGIISP
ncbi:hypothetical protein AUJ77_02715 [Candidatus Nomurabacteria bacterium CG1_02_43_90]|uniref:Uncharacterized protein n=1 Tax=Candidatus Nomurabacteria bacterium CG1_02_43_90 TaxID=1805281 RepID=A0A1J4V8W1_9BACT|nr:MAG: hypothetical protein AUJ77_02715 [Candidatus Nomurabacteria bacterium CG1_02_43_90]